MLIYLSKKASAEHKIPVWKELLAKYDDEAFRKTSYGDRDFSARSNRDILASTVDEYEKGITDTEDEFDDLGMDSVFCYIPLPFKKGDIVRTINSDEVQYGVLPDTPDINYFSSAFTDGDRSDMIVSPDCFFKRDGKYVFGWEHFDFLDLEICPDDELPEDQSILLLLRDVYRGDLDFGAFLFAYSNYGENAYKELYQNNN